MNGARLLTLLPTLHTRRPLTVIGAAVIDIIADAWTLPRRGGDLELQQQSVNVGGCALNIAVALKRLGVLIHLKYEKNREDIGLFGI